MMVMTCWDLLAKAAHKAEARIWAYCLMPNDARLIVVLEGEDGLRLILADAHRRYTGYINARTAKARAKGRRRLWLSIFIKLSP